MGKGDYIDITQMAKRGLVKVPNQGNDNLKVNKEGYIEILPNANSSSNSAPVGSAPSSPASSPFSFFDNPSPSNQAGAQAGSQASSNFNPLASFDSVAQSSSSGSVYGDESNTSSLDVNQMKLKLEDLEYKLSRLSETLDLITNKLANFENKVGI